MSACASSLAVQGFGLFVELDDIYVDGLVHITALDNDYYHFDPVGHRLTGERTGQIYRLGDRLRVKVAAVNLDERKIDFVLPEQKQEQKQKQAPAQGPAKKRSRPRRRRKPAEQSGS